MLRNPDKLITKINFQSHVGQAQALLTPFLKKTDLESFDSVLYLFLFLNDRRSACSASTHATKG